MQTVAASRGFEWWKSGFETVFKLPAVFLVMGLAWGIPILNIFAGLISPALLAGVQLATRKLDSGQTPQIGDLFSGLQTRAGPLIILCLIPFVLGLLLLVLAGVLGGGAIFALASGGAQDGAALAGLFGTLILVAIIAIPVGLLICALLFFAISRVMFDNIAPIDAVKESLAVCLKNIAAVLVFLLCGFVITLGGVLLALIPFIGPIIFATILNPVAAVALYRAYLDVFQPQLQSSFSAPMAPPPPPGAPGW
jgi:hypothetical protein